MYERPIRAQAIEVILRKRPNGMTAAEIAEAVVGKANQDDVKNDLGWLVEQGLIRKDKSTSPHRFYPVRM